MIYPKQFIQKIKMAYTDPTDKIIFDLLEEGSPELGTHLDCSYFMTTKWIETTFSNSSQDILKPVISRVALLEEIYKEWLELQQKQIYDLISTR